MMRMRDLKDQLDSHEERFNSIHQDVTNLRYDVAQLRSDMLNLQEGHNKNHHGKKTKAIQTVFSSGGGLLLLGVITGILRALGVTF